MPIRTVILAGVCMTVAPVLAYQASASRPPAYAADVEVMVGTSGYNSDGELQLALGTQAALATSKRVLAPAADSLNMSLDRVAAVTSAGIVGNTSILRVVVTDRDPDRAVRLAQAVGDSYVENSWVPPQPVGDRADGASPDRSRLGVDGTNRLTELEVARETRPDLRPIGSAQLLSQVEPRPRRAAVAGLAIGALVAAAGVFAQRLIRRGAVLAWS